MKEIYKVHIYFYFLGLSAHSLKLLDIDFAHWFTKYTLFVGDLKSGSLLKC